MIKFLDLQQQYKNIKPEIDTAIEDVLNNASFIGGENVKEFERSFADFCGADYCIGCGNGTDALEIAIEALGLPDGSEIIVPGNSFIASSEAVSRSGHKVVFCDVSTDNYLIDLDDLREKLTEKTSAIIAVHLYGHPCDMDGIKRVIGSRNIKVIEDCAQAHGAEYKGKRVGSLGDIAAFSFYPGKNLGAYGDAGAIVTTNKSIADKARMIANHGRLSKYDHEFEGRNSRLDGLQAAILRVKLRHLDSWTNNRIRLADFYMRELQGIEGVKVPERSSWAKQVYHLFVIQCKQREELASYLLEQQIETGIHYPVALPKLKAYSYLGAPDSSASWFELDTKVLSLPIGDHLTESDIAKVCAFIRKFYE